MKKIILILLLPITSLFAQEEEIDYSALSEKEILQIIDESLLNKDRSIDLIFQNLDPENKNYKRFEDYVMSKAKEMIEGEDLDYPLYLVESVLYNNLENDEARELYSVVISKQLEIKDRIAEEKEKEELKSKEVEGVAKDIETQFDKEVLLESTFTNTQELLAAMEKSREEEVSGRHISHNIIFPFSNTTYNSGTYDDFVKRDKEEHTIRGFSFFMGNEIIWDLMSLRFDVNIDALYLDGSDEAVNNIIGDVTFCLGFPRLIVPIYLSTGYYHHYYHYDDVDDSVVAITNLPTPTIGISILDFNLLYVAQLDVGVHAFIAPFYTDALDFGYLTKAYMTINVVKFSKYSFDIKGGVDYVSLNEGGLTEESFRLKIGLGFSSYE